MPCIEQCLAKERKIKKKNLIRKKYQINYFIKYKYRYSLKFTLPRIPAKMWFPSGNTARRVDCHFRAWRKVFYKGKGSQ